MDTAVRISSQCRETSYQGSVTGPGEGITVQDNIADAGLVANDQIITINGRPLRDLALADWRREWARTDNPGGKVHLGVRRSGSEIEIPVPTSERESIESAMPQLLSYQCEGRRGELTTLSFYRVSENEGFVRLGETPWQRATKSSGQIFRVGFYSGRAGVSAGAIQLGSKYVPAFLSGEICPAPLRQQAPIIPNCGGLGAGIRFDWGRTHLRSDATYSLYDPQNDPPRPVLSLSLGIGTEFLTTWERDSVRRSHVAMFRPTLVLPTGERTEAHLNVQAQDGVEVSWWGVVGTNIFLGETAPLIGNTPYQLFVGVDITLPTNDSERRDQPGSNLVYSLVKLWTGYKLGQLSEHVNGEPGWVRAGLGLQSELMLVAGENYMPGTAAFQSAVDETAPDGSLWMTLPALVVGGVVLGHGVSRDDTALVGAGNYLVTNGLGGLAHSWWSQQRGHFWKPFFWRLGVAAVDGLIAATLASSEENRPMGMSMIGPPAGLVVFDVAELLRGSHSR